MNDFHLEELNSFSFEERVIFDDSLFWFQKVLLDSSQTRTCIYFEFCDKRNSLKKVKNIIETYKDRIHFKNLYFYNANDFVNLVLWIPFYLPKNINLFINTSCFIGCHFCDNKNDLFINLPFQSIQSFFSRYPVWDNINVNILGQGDPLFHPNIEEILSYLKKWRLHITFFSWGKSLLYAKNIDFLRMHIDEFKINLSSSTSEVYNGTHSHKISSEDFQKLQKILLTIKEKTTLISVIDSGNITDIYNFYLFAFQNRFLWVEFKKDMLYRPSNPLYKSEIVKKISQIFDQFMMQESLNFISNISPKYIKYVTFSPFLEKNTSILDTYIQDFVQDISVSDINNQNICLQFWNSIDLTEKNEVSLCCHYDDGLISSVDYEEVYYKNPLFVEKFEEYKKATPSNCKHCPMPMDRYKSILKYNFVTTL